MYRYNDNTFRTNPPAQVEYKGYIRNFSDLSREQLDSIGYNEAVPAPRAPFASYQTRWIKGDDLVYREEILSSTVDEAARFSAARTVKQREIVEKADATLKRTTAQYGDLERQTWDQQYAEATHLLKDGTTSVPLLDAIAASRSMNTTELAGRIVANRAEWIRISGAVVGQRLSFQEALDAAVNADEVEAITVIYAIPE